MKTAPIFWTSLLATLSMSTMTAFAVPIDVGKSEASKEKTGRHAEIYKQLPSEAFRACLGRSSGVQCSYDLPPTNSRPFSQRVDGSCWAPENSIKLPQGCR
jgi:hypothetical protein